MYFSTPSAGDQFELSNYPELSLSPNFEVQNSDLQPLNNNSIASWSHPDCYGRPGFYHHNIRERGISAESPALQRAYTGLPTTPRGTQLDHPGICLQWDLFATSPQQHGFQDGDNANLSEGALATNPEDTSDPHALRAGCYNLQAVEQDCYGVRQRMAIASAPQGQEELTSDGGSYNGRTDPYSRGPDQSMGQVNIVRHVGSVANTTVALKNRRKKPLYFCRVPRCTSRGFTQKHNFEPSKISFQQQTIPVR
ncbi:hypothetical protein PM082_011499 [Marasmius tenuissimus]|nr:hypothetical protein PM082_011499 [Marasmius tenuissimus]